MSANPSFLKRKDKELIVRTKLKGVGMPNLDFYCHFHLIRLNLFSPQTQIGCFEKICGSDNNITDEILTCIGLCLICYFETFGGSKIFLTIF